MSDERAAFEAWAEKADNFALNKVRGEHYSDPLARIAWLAWETRARRAAPPAVGGEPPSAIDYWHGRALEDARESPTPIGCVDAFEIRLNDDGTLDEIVGTGTVHLEQMDRDHWWIGFGGRELIHVNMRAKGKIKATVMDERPLTRGVVGDPSPIQAERPHKDEIGLFYCEAHGAGRLPCAICAQGEKE